LNAFIKEETPVRRHHLRRLVAQCGQVSTD